MKKCFQILLDERVLIDTTKPTPFAFFDSLEPLLTLRYKARASFAPAAGSSRLAPNGCLSPPEGYFLRRRVVVVRDELGPAVSELTFLARASFSEFIFASLVLLGSGGILKTPSDES